MEALFTVLGFTTLESTLWNLAAYVAFVGIIVGVLYEPLRNHLITAGAAILAAYSALFLHNPMFAALQTIIAVSGAMQLWRVPSWHATNTILTLTVIAVSVLVFGCASHGNQTMLGVIGLVGIAFGLVLAPRRSGFGLMAAGGVLLVAYAWIVGAWVFFWLNIFFALANVKEIVAAKK